MLSGYVDKSMAQRTFSEIEHGSVAYEQSLALRDEVLRKPLGLSFSDEELELERGLYHLACQEERQVLGCLVLVPHEDGTIRMRQVAVAAHVQRQGIGCALTELAEQLARDRGFSAVTLNARDTAVGFYEKLGYQRVGEPFVMVSIQHWFMEKEL